MERLDPKEHEVFMNLAWEEAKKAKCQRSHFGAIIVKEGNVLTKGHNEPVGEACKICLREQKNPDHGLYAELCFAIHAEQAVLLNALKEQKDISNAVMYIGHIREGKKEELLGEPCCTICSRLVADSGLKGVVFYAGDHYIFLTANEFNERSLKNIIEKHGIKLDEELIKAGSNKI